MSGVVVLDNAALEALASGEGKARAAVRAALTAVLRLRRNVVVPAVVLAEMYRGRGHNQVVDTCLSRETGILVRDTDRAFARLVGGVLTGSRAASEDIVDAHVVTVAVEAGGGVCLTRDADGIGRLSAPYANNSVVDIDN